LNWSAAGSLAPGVIASILLKLASPVVAEEEAPQLAALDFSRSREAIASYWEDWLAQGARFEVPETAVNDLYRANLWHAPFTCHRTDEHGVPRIDLPYSNRYGQRTRTGPSTRRSM
jgi:hypothetical protein